MSVPPSTTRPPASPEPPRLDSPSSPAASAPAGAGALLGSLLFVAWCFVVGTLLMYAPWMPAWVRWTAAFTDPRIQAVVGHPTFRGAVSGFGLFHLVWGTHDLDLLIARFLHKREARSRADRGQAGDSRSEEGRTEGR